MGIIGIGKDEADEGLSELFGPGHVDRQIREAIQHCWMGLSKEKRSVEEVEKQIRRLVERALRDFREDAAALLPHASQ